MSSQPLQAESAQPPATVRMVAIDLDGTLLDDAKQVSRPTADALASAIERGVKVVIASARPPRSVAHIYQQLNLDTPQINYNGALIWDPPGRQMLYHCPLSPAMVLAIAAFARDMFEEVLVSCEILDRWYTDREEQPYTTQTGKLFRPDLVAPLEQFCVEPITKLMLLGEPRLIGRLEPLLTEQFPLVNIIRSDPELLQIMDRRVSKAAALTRVAGRYAIPLAEVMAIGDAVNDIPMLQAAGVAIAMDNAAYEVKRICHWVCPSNNDHGVHAALRRYGLCE